jgi:hypothetical protein
MSKITLLGGPSGSGKSKFASEHLTARKWSHLEIDRWPAQDGVDFYKIRPEWDQFIHQYNSGPLHELLVPRALGFTGMVLSLSSRILFNSHHLAAAAGRFHIAYLYGHPAFCLNAFLHSPKAIELGLGPDHWNYHNYELFGGLSRPENHRLLIDSFTGDGVRRDPQKIYDDLLNLLNAN